MDRGARLDGPLNCYNSRAYQYLIGSDNSAMSAQRHDISQTLGILNKNELGDKVSQLFELIDLNRAQPSSSSLSTLQLT